MADNVKNQMRPIARNLKPPPPPRFVQESQRQQIRPEPNNCATFTTNVLAFQSLKKVRISHCENGPFLFYVQVESSDNDFHRLVSRLQKTELRRLHQRPAFVGTPCLTILDKKVFRVAVIKLPQHQNEEYIASFVDFGFTKAVSLENLFYIPDDILSQFTYAMPFTLAGCRPNELKVNEKEATFYFRLLIDKQPLTLKCVPGNGPTNCHYCELFIDDKVNVLDKLKQWDPYNSLKFRPQSQLEMKVAQEVKVSYVESAQEFYIHLQNPEILKEYDVTSDELFQVMSRSPIYRKPKPGSCCAVFLGGEYYRGQVVGAKSSNTVQVKIVDFGIIEEIPEKHVHLLTERFVEKPPQAHRVGLKGFEGLEVSENICTQFDIFCGDGRGERKIFKMVIIEKSDDTCLVELEDFSTNPPVNVNKMLLKNSRPLIETIQLENAKKRQKEGRNFSNRGREPRSPPPVNNNQPEGKQQSPRTHFGKSENSSVAGTYFKSSKEASVWGSKESTPSDHNSIKSSDWEQPKNISREQHSSSSWNDEANAQRGQKAKSPKGGNKQKNEGPQKKSGWVSTLLSVNRAVVHFDEHIEGLQKILDEMFAFYENKNSRPLVKDLQPGIDCAARSTDGNWYRSKVDSINGDKVKVFFREYGNSEVLHKSKLRALDEKFAALSDLSVTTYFAVKPTPDCDEKSLFNEMVKIFENGAKEFNFKIVQALLGGWVLEPIDNNTNKNVIDELVKTKKAQRITSNELMDLLEGKLIEKPKEQPRKEKKSPEKEKRPVEKVKKVAEQKPEVTTKAEVKPEVKEEPAKAEGKRKSPEKTRKTATPQPLDTSRIPVKMTALTSPTDFYISRSDQAAKFAQLHTDIQIIATGAAPLKDFEEGWLCLAQQPFDLCWYRAKIIDSDETDAMITVRCLDDGKTFSVDDKSFLKMIPTALARKKFFGMECSLSVKIERKCEEEASDLMMQMMQSELQVDFIGDAQQDCLNYVELFNGDANVADLLATKKLASRLELIKPGKVFTSHINSVTSFYLQFESDQLKLELISQYFEESNGNFEVVEAEPGMIVAALYPEDDCWYRTKVEAVESDGVLVSFIDYGNSCLVKKIGKIAESTIQELPAMSKHCSLKKPKDVESFSEAAEKRFVEICAGGATILDVRSAPIKPGEAAEVEIFLDGLNIVEQLLPLCETSNGILDTTNESIDS